VIVMPAKAGIQRHELLPGSWTPAFAGVTIKFQCWPSTTSKLSMTA
jgi:hypothetical protein